MFSREIILDIEASPFRKIIPIFTLQCQQHIFSKIVLIWSSYFFYQKTEKFHPSNGSEYFNMRKKMKYDQRKQSVNRLANVHKKWTIFSQCA